MRIRCLVLFLSVIFVPVALAQDPVMTDGDKYKVILENDAVRVLDYLDHPGERTTMHHHPDFVLYALTPFQRTLTLANGTVIKREFKSGDVLWSPAQEHIGENVGSTDTHVVIVELKSTTTAAANPAEPVNNPESK